MVDTYKINGKPVTKDAFDNYTASNPMPTFPSLSDQASLSKISNPEILGEPNPVIQEFGAGAGRGFINNYGSIRDLGDVAPGAEPSEPDKVDEVFITGQDGTNSNTVPDMRVKIRVPSDYLTPLTSGSGRNELYNHGGIIFPYTPTISFDYKADYSTSPVIHNNYSINFYKHSSVSDIAITGKFTVQNDQDALVYLSTIHLLRSLTKMRFGGGFNAGAGRGGANFADSDSGAPPPICRLDAYGDFMLKNIPVAIVAFKNDMPNDVDFYKVDKLNQLNQPFGSASVPVSSTISVTCKPMYSRAEMLGMSVSKYLNQSSYKKAGYL